MTTTVPIEDDATRRQFLVGGAALTGLLIARGEAGSEPAGSPRAAGNGFPVTIEHRFGSTEIPTRPQRIVTLGVFDHDALLALGVVPVGTSDWYGDYAGAVWPWARDELGAAAVPETMDHLTDGIQYEQIAALRPDLILAVSWKFERPGDFDLLNQIAPTVAQDGDLAFFAVPWQESARKAGRAVGLAEQAELLVADLEARYGQTKAAHPEFSRATALQVQPNGDGSHTAYVPPDLGGQFLVDLGFRVPDAIAALTAAQEFPQISAERLDLVEADVLVWLLPDEATRDGLLSNPLYTNLDVVTQGRDVFLVDGTETDLVYSAIGFQTVLSLPLLFDQLIPMLAAAVDGDPATEVPS